MRSLRCMLENPKSSSRLICMTLFETKLHSQGKFEKLSRQGFKVHRIEENKYIDCTDNYSDAIQLVACFNRELMTPKVLGRGLNSSASRSRLNSQKNEVPTFDPS